MENKLIKRLIKGNEEYVSVGCFDGGVSSDIRKETTLNGQHPFAVIVTCSDSRVIPEVIFNQGIGKLFVIRVAGNVIGEHELGSIEYACSHLGCKLLVVMGHTHCGAIHSVIEGHGGGYVDYLLNPIKVAIGDEKDELKASKKNAVYGANLIKEKLKDLDAEVIPAIYDIETGKVELL